MRAHQKASKTTKKLKETNVSRIRVFVYVKMYSVNFLIMYLEYTFMLICTR